MITLSRASDQAKVLEASQHPDDVRISVELEIGDEGKRYGGRLYDADWGQSAVPISFSGQIAGVPPRRLENEQQRLSVIIDGICVPQLYGNFGVMAVNQDRITATLQAASSGALLPRVGLEEPVEYQGVPPEYIIQDALLRCSSPTGGYDAANFEIEPVGSPLLDFSGSQGFKPQEHPSDILSRMGQNQQFTYIFSDTANNGHKAVIDHGTGSVDNISYTYDAQDIPDWVPPARQTEQYSHVVVYKEGDDGSWEYSDTAPIIYRGVVTQPFSNVPLTVALSAQTGYGVEVAEQLAFTLADAQSRGRYAGACTLPFFNPLLEKVDSMKVNETAVDDDGMWVRSWLLRVDQYKQVYTRSSQSTNTSSSSTTGVSVVGPAQAFSTQSDVLTLSSQINYTATILEEDLIKAPSLALSTLSSGVLESLSDAYFGNALGFWFEPLLTTTGGQPWIYLDADGGWVDPALSGGLATADATGIYLEF